MGMKLRSAGFILLASAIVGLGAAGCHSSDDAPTNSGNSKYIDNGQTAADKIGAARAAGHGSRLPGKGGAGAPPVAPAPQ
jgi:hypothetical protein